MVVHDIAALIGELLLGAIGIGDPGMAGKGVVATSDGVLAASKAKLKCASSATTGNCSSRSRGREGKRSKDS